MNEQELNCFLSAARYLNFSDAAHHLYLSQSAFSRNIAKLEKELQVTLFYRNTKSVELTAAGFFLSQQLNDLYMDYLLCVQKAQMIENGLTGKLRLGLLEGQAMEPNFQAALNRYTNIAKEINCTVQRNSYNDLLQKLDQHFYDGIVTLETEAGGREELDYFPLSSLKTVLVVPSFHPLANKKKVSVSDLEDETYLVPKDISDATDRLISGFFDAQNIQVKCKYVDHMNDQLISLEAGQGVAVLNEHNLTCYSPALVRIEAGFFPDSNMVFAYRKDNHNPALHRFLEELT